VNEITQQNDLIDTGYTLINYDCISTLFSNYSSLIKYNLIYYFNIITAQSGVTL